MTAHDLNDADHARVVHPCVVVDLHAGGGNILRGGGVAGAVVGAEEVVVDGLGYAHDAALIAGLLHILADLVAGIHGVVSAVIEEVPDVVLLEDFKDALVIRIVHIGVSDFVAAGAESGRGGVKQVLQLCSVLKGHVDQPVIEHALDSVLRAVDLCNRIAVQRGADNAVRTGIDDGSGTAGLTYNTSAFQNIHNCVPPIFVIYLSFSPCLSIASFS